MYMALSHLFLLWKCNPSINNGFSDESFPALAACARTGRRDAQKASRHATPGTRSPPPKRTAGGGNQAWCDRRQPPATFRGNEGDDQDLPQRGRRNWSCPHQRQEWASLFYLILSMLHIELDVVSCLGQYMSMYFDVLTSMLMVTNPQNN